MRKIKRILTLIFDYLFPSDILNKAHKFAKFDDSQFALKIDGIEDFAIPFNYRDEIKDCILAYKYRDKPHYAEFFSRTIAGATANKFRDVKIDAVVSVPTILDDKQDFDHAGYLARKVATNILVPYIKHAMIKTRKTEKQHFLDYQQRLENVKDLYAANVKKQHKINGNILLIDDIITTGATVASAAEALRAAGANKVYVAATAYTNLKNYREVKL